LSAHILIGEPVASSPGYALMRIYRNLTWSQTSLRAARAAVDKTIHPS
jgi:hypothetical protein